MSEAAYETTPLSDLSASIFATLLLILLILLHGLGATPPAPAARSAPPDADRDLGAVARAPLAPAELVELLRARGRADGLSFDLREDGIGLADGPGPAAETLDPATGASALAAALAPRLRDAGPGAQARLYVFSNRGYPALAAALASAGLGWREVSVPAALTGPDGGWTEGFLALIRGDPRPERFRAWLGNLLGGGPDPVRGGRTGSPTGAATAAPSPPGGTLLGRLSAILGIAVTLAGIALVGAVEFLAGRPDAG